MPTERSTRRDRRADEIQQELQAQLPDTDPSVVQEFGRRLFVRVPTERLEEAEPGVVGREAASLFRLLEATPPEDLGVAIHRLPDRPHRAVLLTTMPDSPFIVETLKELLTSEDLSILAVLHPILELGRSADGRISAVLGRGSGVRRMSITLSLIEGQLEPGRERELEHEVRRRLSSVRLATRDFEAMLAAARAISEDLERLKVNLEGRTSELDEIQELLQWLANGNFVFLGYREYDLSRADVDRPKVHVRRGSSLGILAEESSSRLFDPVPLGDLAPDLRARLLTGPGLIVSKTNALSPVHRRARMDDISIKRLSPDGRVLGERRFLGLFTAKAIAQDASATPILRRKLREIMELEEVEAGTHDHGLIMRVFNSLPKEDLFIAPVEELLPLIDSVMETHASDDVLVVSRPDALGRGVNVMVVMPRQRFSDEARRRIQDLLAEAYGGQVLDYRLAMGEGAQARLHFHLAARVETIERVEVRDLQARVREAIRSWQERLRAALDRVTDPERALALATRYGEAFSPEYRAATAIHTAVRDIETVEQVRATARRRVTLVDLDPPQADRCWLTAFDRGARYALSDVLPVLENFGFRVIRAEAHELTVQGEEVPYTIHGFLVDVPPEMADDRSSVEPRVEEALHAVQSGWAENLAINRLILSAGLDWRRVALLKAYGAYAFRIGAVSSRLGLRRPLVRYPHAARLLYEIFAAQFDPHLEDDRDTAVLGLVDAFQEALQDVEGIEDDRTLRRLYNLVDATVRTNYFQARLRDHPDAPIALKFDCRRVETMPAPRPRHEIWVSSARTEGAHLRMGDVARGGLRWSDRTEDFRVEVLGLVKTQQVKNAVIVPAGAKGAFVVVRPPADRSRLREAGETSYRDFVSGLLDITDNIQDGTIVHPPETIIRDGDDPYLVVAADKGTATLSDTANELSAEYAFWMGDAFASGGSKGYDHKVMGITARGAWECVKRHFRELGKDIQQEVFTVVGIGDMSGDVFGNGMLLSPKIKLIAAFDHRNIFIDPDPDPEVSWTERKRLFELPASGWTDYDPHLISEGGGVWGRGDKRIDVSNRAREALAIEADSLNGDALIQAILAAPVELLWNGGIGTYVRSSSETDTEVADPGNDLVRIAAPELRAQVIGEGGNLGLTQLARIEYASGGGRLNTDALDNSAGVDTSDHEVNIKILLGPAVADGRISLDERDRLLGVVADDVAHDVLRNCYRQSLAVSLDEHRVRRNPVVFADALRHLEKGGFLDRHLEQLPTTEDLAERREQGRPVLTRPELSVLLAYAKLHLKGRLLESPVVDDPALLDLARTYFPARVMEAAGEETLGAHRLRANIAVTVLTNLLVDTMGSAGLIGLTRETQRHPADVAKAWYVACRVAGSEDLRSGILGMDDRVTAGVQTQWLLALAEALARSTRWLLANADLERSIEELVSWYGAPVQQLRTRLTDLLPEPKRARVGDRVALHMADGMTKDLASSLVFVEFLDGLLPVASLSRIGGITADSVGEVYFGLAADIDFPWLQDCLVELPGADSWEQMAARALLIDLEAARRLIVNQLLLQVEGETGDMSAVMDRFRSHCAQGLRRIGDLMDELKESERPSLAALTVAVHSVSDQCREWSQKAR
jgi:glutamate dehydrogenase